MNGLVHHSPQIKTKCRSLQMGPLRIDYSTGNYCLCELNYHKGIRKEFLLPNDKIKFVWDVEISRIYLWIGHKHVHASQTKSHLL